MKTQDLISDAAEASERFGDAECERYAAAVKARPVTSPDPDHPGPWKWRCANGDWFLEASNGGTVMVIRASSLTPNGKDGPAIAMVPELVAFVRIAAEMFHGSSGERTSIVRELAHSLLSKLAKLS